MQSKEEIKLPQDLYQIIKEIDPQEIKGLLKLDESKQSVVLDTEDFLISLDTYILKHGLVGDDYDISDYGIKLYHLYDYICDY